MRQSGGQVFLDLGSPKLHLEQLLQHVDGLNCPERLIQRLFATDDLEEGGQRLLAMGPREVTITLGEFGAIHFTGDTVTRHTTFPVDAVDTNGAGDVFCGAILYGTVHHWETEKKLAFACAAAALKCRQLGNRAALPTLEEIDLRTRQGGCDGIARQRVAKSRRPCDCRFVESSRNSKETWDVSIHSTVLACCSSILYNTFGSTEYFVMPSLHRNANSHDTRIR